MQWVSLNHPSKQLMMQPLTHMEMHRILILKAFHYHNELIISLGLMNSLYFQKHYFCFLLISNWSPLEETHVMAPENNKNLQMSVTKNLRM